MGMPLVPALLAYGLMSKAFGGRGTGAQVSDQEAARMPTDPRDVAGAQVSDQEAALMGSGSAVPPLTGQWDALRLLMLLQQQAAGAQGATMTPAEDTRPKSLEEALSQFYGSGAAGAPMSMGGAVGGGTY